MLKHVKWLLPEINQWVEAGIIDFAQAEAIRGSYPSTNETTSWARTIFLAMGAVLFGLGVILLIAYNWEEMHKAVKLGLIGLSLASAHVLGMWFRRPESRSFDFDFSNERWFVKDKAGHLETGTLPWSERFRIVYRPSSPEDCRSLPNKEFIWHGHLPSRAFHGGGSVD